MFPRSSFNSYARSILGRAVVVSLAFLAVGSMQAQDYFLVGKSQHLIQKGVSNVVADPTAPFVFGAASTKSGLELTIPGGAKFPLLYDSHDESYEYQRSFATKAEMDAAFPNGTYTISGPGIPVLTIVLTGDQYPVSPQVTGGTWNAGGSLLLAPATATTINFNTFTGYATAGAIGHSRAEFGSLDPDTWSRSVPGFNLNVAPQAINSLAIPGSALVTNGFSTGGLTFTTYTTLDSTTVAGGVAMAFYESDLTFFVSSLTSGTGGNPPVITSQPINLSVAAGGTATFPFAATTGAGQGIAYEWRRNGEYMGVNPRFTTTASGRLIITNVTAADAGNYAVRVQNQGGNVSSNIVTLTVTGPTQPAIVTTPRSQTLSVGQSATLTVDASGGATNSYQWNKDGVAIAGAISASLALTNVQAAASGSYTVTVRNEVGSVTSNAAIVLVSNGPGLTTQLQSQNVAASAPVTLTIAATGSGLTYQWKKNGVAIAGATSATYTIASAQTSDMGFYSCIVTSGGNSTESATATVTVTGGAPTRPTNISTRALVTAAEPLTAGFVLSAPKTILIRACGPALTTYGVGGVLADPRLELIPLGGSTVIASNNDWGTASNLAALNTVTTATGAFTFAAGSKDAAMLISLPAGGYSARVTDANGGSGIALVEVYDADSSAASGQLINISARAMVGLGDAALVCGFVVAGVAPRQILIRAVGPGLAAYGVPNLLQDPQLTVIPLGANFSIATNDNWGGTAALKAASAAAGAFDLNESSKDAAVLLRLPPGGYSVVFTGVAGTTGTALVEVYDLGP